jgi:bacterioferritin-associated ferredoxin
MKKTFVCRCEDVTLEEVEQAIAKGFTDVESIKRYTGFGTGWCQGKGCVALCAEVMERHGLSMEQPFTARSPLQPLELGALAMLIDSISGPDAISGADSISDVEKGGA